MNTDNTQDGAEPSPASAGSAWTPLARDVRLLCKPTLMLDGVELLGVARDEGGNRYVARVLWKELRPANEEYHLNPTLYLATEKAQELMDGLWSCGIRPTEGNGSAGAMRAAERHIEDLRKVAFKALGIG